MEKNTQNNQPNYIIQKMYTKDLSFEAPNTPEIFKRQWQPETRFDFDIKQKECSKKTYEVELILHITTKSNKNTAYMIEVIQAGIFILINSPKSQIDLILKAFCPNTLFPYAKTVINNLINKGGFPQINLQPINFEAFYMETMSKTFKKSDNLK